MSDPEIYTPLPSPSPDPAPSTPSAAPTSPSPGPYSPWLDTSSEPEAVPIDQTVAVQLQHNQNSSDQQQQQAQVVVQPEQVQPEQENQVAEIPNTTDRDGNMLIYVGHDQLHPFCHSDVQYVALAHAGRTVVARPNSITERQILTHRLSHINALLIQSRGRFRPTPCNQCQTRDRPFFGCRYLPGFWNNVCGNCKWHDQGRSCSYYERDARPSAGPAQSPVNVDLTDTNDEGVIDLTLEDSSAGQVSHIIVIDDD